MDTQKKKSFIISVTYTVLVVALIYVIYRFLIIYLLPFAIGLVLAYLLQKPSDYISGKLRIKKGTVSAVLVVVSFISLVAVLFGILAVVYRRICLINKSAQSHTHLPQILRPQILPVHQKLPHKSTKTGCRQIRAFAVCLFQF